jgi:hypothetical protein
MEELDLLIKTHYESWIANAPRSYRDAFIRQRMPIVVTSLYGQNQLIMETEEDSDSWRRQRNYSDVHYMSVAIATHLRYLLFIFTPFIYLFIPSSARLASTWEDLDVNELWMSHEDGLFTSHDPNHRQQLTLEELLELAMEDEDGKEIRIYNSQGFYIQRRLGHVSQKPLGVLANISSVNELFRPQYNDDTIYPQGLPGPHNPSIYVYPQAGLRSAGHFQASGLISSFYPHIEDLNQRLRDNLNPHGGTPIMGIASQGYNSVMHSTRGHGVQHHEAQQGLVTAAMGGRFTTTKMKDRSRQFVNTCNNSLPHKRFDLKINNNALQRDLRLENIYVIDITALRREDRGGE